MSSPSIVFLWQVTRGDALGAAEMQGEGLAAVVHNAPPDNNHLQLKNFYSQRREAFVFNKYIL